MVSPVTTDRLKAIGEQTVGVQSQYLTRRHSRNGEADTLSKRLAATYDVYRQIRKHPPVALARALSIAPVIAGDWLYEADDDVDCERVCFIQDQLNPMRSRLLQVCMEHGCDYGWSPWEKVFEVRKWNGKSVVWLKNMKPLLVDLTTVLLDGETGQFAGFEQSTTSGTLEEVELELPYAFLANFRVEGDGHYGEPLLENVRRPWNDWTEANKGAQRYDRKVAGAHWVIYFPVASTLLDGVLTPNDTIANDMLDALEASGCIAIPQVFGRWVEDLEKGGGGAWRVEKIDSTGHQADFGNRLGYLDTQMVRGLLMPERSILEGQFGTKAEAGVHAGLALTQRELEHEHVTRLIQWHIVDQLLALNFGDDARGSVRLVAAPLVDSKRAFLEQVYAAILANPLGFTDAFDALDLDGLMDAIALPKIAERVEGEVSGIDMQNQMVGLMQELYQKATNGTPSG